MALIKKFRIKSFKENRSAIELKFLLALAIEKY